MLLRQRVITLATEKQRFLNRSFTSNHLYTRRDILGLGGAALSLTLASTCFGCRPRSEKKAETKKPPNILVFLADALVADHLGCYGYKIPTSPRIDAFAGSSIVFDRCYSQSCWTKPSIASLFSGYVPYVHRAVSTTSDPDNPGEEQVEMFRGTFVSLASALGKLGYQTALYQSNPHCQQRFGFGQGFSEYRYVSAEKPAQQVDAVIDWLKAAPDNPFFLFVHEIDPHSPYTPDEKFYRQLFDLDPKQQMEKLSADDRMIIDGYDLRYTPDVPRFFLPRLRELSPEGTNYLKRLYDAEIRGVDYHFGRVLDSLNAFGLSENTVVCFISDHGQAFGEHGFYGHNHSLYQEVLHVPMVIRLPGQTAAMRIPWNMSLYDLNPTLVTLGGGEPEHGMQAKSLLSKDGTPMITENRPVYAYYDASEPQMSAWQFCLIQDNYKVIDHGEIGRPEIYDLGNDPKERTNIFGPLPESEELAEKTRLIRREHLALSEMHGKPEYYKRDQNTQDELRALGYF